MGTIPLRQFLKSLCCSSWWNYAVFWKLQYQNQVILTWEDGYCDIPKGHLAESTSDSICSEGLNELLYSVNLQGGKFDGNCGGGKVEVAVASMSSLQYALGDGVVGDVALKGNYHWILSDNPSPCKFQSKLMPEFPDEWLPQFAAGVKSILLVPVVPQGVLQLGSLKMVAEDLAMVNDIRDKFIAYRTLVEFPETFARNQELVARLSSLMIPALGGNHGDLLAFEINSEHSTNFDGIQPTLCEMLTENQTTTPNKTPSTVCISGLGVPKIVNISKGDVDSELGSNRSSEPLFNPLSFSNSECLDSEITTFSYSDNLNMGMFGDDGTGMKLPLEEMNSEYAVQKSLGSFLSFPQDCELHKALGPVFMGIDNIYAQDSSITREIYGSSNLICDGDIISGTFFSDGTDHLLEAVVANVNANGFSSTENNYFTASRTFDGQSETENSCLGIENTIPPNHITVEYVNLPRNLFASSSPSATSCESVITELIEQQKKDNGFSNQKKFAKPCGGGKKRVKAGDSQKPRPRDRQLIQDRLKELRELVPNGAKCSIDGLLDRTIAHMQFLRNVSDRADKLKQFTCEEEAGGKNIKSPDQKGGSQSGASWAVELGGEKQVFPIIVEDLDCPGHMMIEMMCDEIGRFLEIAEVIHRLDLTILKGVMEKRLGIAWAHFVIEAPRGLHRLDIFWPLMKLLQQNQSSISSKI